jgi:predicted lipase
LNFNPHLALDCAKQIRSLYVGDVDPNVVARQTDTQALVDKLPDGRFRVTFPGTASLKDWRTDARIRKVAWLGGDPFAGGGMKVHAGFHAALMSVYDAIEKLIPAGRSVVLCGHSLGGALATLCAHALNGVAHVTDVITFGSPRVGNGRFVGEYDHTLAAHTARIVNAHDPVPHVPWVFGTYRHVATQVYLPDAGGVRIDEPLRAAAGEWMQTAQTAFHLQPAAFNLPFSAPHHIESYLWKLKGLT